MRCDVWHGARAIQLFPELLSKVSRCFPFLVWSDDGEDGFFLVVGKHGLHPEHSDDVLSRLLAGQNHGYPLGKVLCEILS
ncbi:hypothetical protein D3C84_689980 [compost metagenome]